MLLLEFSSNISALHKSKHSGMAGHETHALLQPQTCGRHPHVGPLGSHMPREPGFPVLANSL